MWRTRKYRQQKTKWNERLTDASSKLRSFSLSEAFSSSSSWVFYEKELKMFRTSLPLLFLSRGWNFMLEKPCWWQIKVRLYIYYSHLRATKEVYLFSEECIFILEVSHALQLKTDQDFYIDKESRTFHLTESMTVKVSYTRLEWKCQEQNLQLWILLASEYFLSGWCFPPLVF